VKGAPFVAVTVYSTPTCPYCRQVKEYLRSRSISFDERDVSQDAAAAEEMVRVSGQQGVPVTVVDGQAIVGYDRPRLDAALAAAQRPRLGAAVTDASSVAGGAPGSEGAYVGRVRPDGAAARAGLQAGDVIVSLAGRSVRSAIHLEQLMAGVQPGSRIPVVYMRGEQTLRATLEF
jgi:glutaredoxin-like YruB-family protein